MLFPLDTVFLFDKLNDMQSLFETKRFMCGPHEDDFIIKYVCRFEPIYFIEFQVTNIAQVYIIYFQKVLFPISIDIIG